MKTLSGYLTNSETTVGNEHWTEINRMVYDLIWRGIRGQVCMYILDMRYETIKWPSMRLKTFKYILADVTGRIINSILCINIFLQNYPMIFTSSCREKESLTIPLVYFLPWFHMLFFCSFLSWMEPFIEIELFFNGWGGWMIYQISNW